MRISGLITGGVDYPRAIHIYRLTLPLAYINHRTKHQCVWSTSEEVALRSSSESMHKLLRSDIVVLGRPITAKHQDALDYVKLCGTYGAKVVYETDDDLTNVYRDISNGTGANCLPYLNAVDAITVSTRGLSDNLRQFTDKPIYVLPNSVEPLFWHTATDNYRRVYDGTFNIMLAGTPTHENDWRLAYEAVAQVLEKYPATRLLVGGFKPDYISDSDRIVHLPYAHYHDYPKMLCEADVVVCAVDPNDRFNHSKSAVKAIESWAARRVVGRKRLGGAAVIATDSIVYRDTVVNGRNGLLVDHTVYDYFGALELLINNDQLRHTLQVNGNSDMLRHHSIAENYHKWVTAYQKIVKGDKR